MTTRPKTHTVLILDQSSSMASRTGFAVETYNEQVVQAQLNAKDQDIVVSLITFNHDVFLHHWAVPADQLLQSTAEGYRCGGNTALDDAVGYAVQKLLADDDGETCYLVQAITDGEENSSQHFNVTHDLETHTTANPLRDLIARFQATGRATVTYTGCGVDYLKTLADRTGVPKGNLAAMSFSNQGGATGSQTASAGQHYANVLRGVTASPCFASPVPDAVADVQQVGNAVEQGKLSWLHQQLGGALVAGPDGQQVVNVPSNFAAKADCFGGLENKKVKWETADTAQQ